MTDYRTLDDLDKELNEMSEANAFEELSSTVDDYDSYSNSSNVLYDLVKDNKKLREELDRLKDDYYGLSEDHYQLRKRESDLDMMLGIANTSLEQTSQDYLATNKDLDEYKQQYDALVIEHNKLKAVLRKHVTVLKTVRSDLLKDGDLYAEDTDGHFGVTSSDYRI